MTLFFAFFSLLFTALPPGGSQNVELSRSQSSSGRSGLASKRIAVPAVLPAEQKQTWNWRAQEPLDTPGESAQLPAPGVEWTAVAYERPVYRHVVAVETSFQARAPPLDLPS